MLLRIMSNYFVAGKDGKNVAPIIKYMKNWSDSDVRRYCNKKGWEFEIIRTRET